MMNNKNMRTAVMRKKEEEEKKREQTNNKKKVSIADISRKTLCCM